MTVRQSPRVSQVNTVGHCEIISRVVMIKLKTQL